MPTNSYGSDLDGWAATQAPTEFTNVSNRGRVTNHQFTNNSITRGMLVLATSTVTYCPYLKKDIHLQVWIPRAANMLVRGLRGVTYEERLNVLLKAT